MDECHRCGRPEELRCGHCDKPLCEWCSLEPSYGFCNLTCKGRARQPPTTDEDEG